MTSAPTQQPKFLPSRNELGLVAVGFSGGQVSRSVSIAVTGYLNDSRSVKPESMPRPWH
jgi:hypothetical protein